MVPGSPRDSGDGAFNHRGPFHSMINTFRLLDVASLRSRAACDEDRPECTNRHCDGAAYRSRSRKQRPT